MNKFPAAGQHSTNGTSQALAQVQPNRINGRGELGSRDTGRNHCIHEPCPIHVHTQPSATGHFGHRLQAFQRPDRPAPAV